MRFTFAPLTCLVLLIVASPVMAKDKKHEKQMDPQAMMEVYQKLATPVNLTSCSQPWPAVGQRRPSPGWNQASPQWNRPAPQK